MYWLLLIVFVLGYMLIIFEQKIQIDKAASAILTGVLCWVVLFFGRATILGSQPELLEPIGENLKFLDSKLFESVSEIAAILFFLLSAMTIVELIDAHKGFEVITEKITTTSKIKLLWLITFITFFLSSVLDNLTTAIVMAALLKKLITEKEDLWFFGGMVIIAANAGGAWSPIGDVTTIMLWIGGQITAGKIMMTVFLPSIACIVFPLIILTFQVNGKIERPISSVNEDENPYTVTNFEKKLIFWLGVGGLLFVPIFKDITHLPPFMGILFSLGVLWLVTEIIHRHKRQDFRHILSIAGVIRKIDTPSILFFLGILLAVASLQTGGHLTKLAQVLDSTFSNIYVINTLIGLLSSIIDNVPLVAGAMGMYSMDRYHSDHIFWNLLAYCAGTGGSVLIIGSAAGVAMMGLLKIDFNWYFKKISWLALIGYLSGVLILYMEKILNH